MLDEEEIDTDPMARMKPPIVPEIPVEVLTDSQLRALLKACTGKDFRSRRDTAIVRLFADTGLRLGELSALSINHLDLDTNVASVRRKGRKPGIAPFGSKTAIALDRYLRARAAHRGGEASRALWLADKGGRPMTSSGIARLLRNRGEQAGISGLHPHQIRHTTVHVWFDNGGSEGDAMRLFGWKSRQMLHRYAASAADARARDAHLRLALGDRI